MTGGDGRHTDDRQADHRRIAELRAENEALRAEIAMLRAPADKDAADVWRLRRALDLTPMQGRIVNILRARECVSMETLIALLYDGRDVSRPEAAVKQQISLARPRLGAHRIAVEAIGDGAYRLPPASRRRLDEIVAREAQA